MSQLALIASQDDFLLEEALREAVDEACAVFDGVQAESVPPETTPEQLAVDLCSPSLFAPQRVLVAPDVRLWLDAPAPSTAPKAGGRRKGVDVGPLVHVLEEGLSDSIALVMGAWCGRQPKGPLFEVVKKKGTLEWRAVPEPPKPWQDVALTKEQTEVLRGVLGRASSDVRFVPDAEKLLFERLGFAPRLLVQEVRKLAAATSSGVVDVDLVRALCFPRERSLDVVRDSFLGRRPKPILDLISAAQRGISVRDRQGRIMEAQRVPLVLVAQASAMFQQLLYLRRLAAAKGLANEMLPERTRRPRWYVRHFKDGIAPGFSAALEADAPSPVMPPRGRLPTPWSLGQLFVAAGLYQDEELISGLSSIAEIEASTRGPLAMEALSGWVASTI